MEDADSLLIKTSRTFALAIPLLPEPTRKEVAIGYLVFRIVDTFEDSERWSTTQRTNALRDFAEILALPPGEEAAQMAADCLREPPVDRADYMALLAHIPLVLDELARLGPEARHLICGHAARTARGMSGFVSQTSADGILRLETLQELRDYCYVVAGIVGELLTDLYLLDHPALETVAADLRARAPAFGEGLQLVNILKDVDPDTRDGRLYLPDAVGLAEIFALARDDLRDAARYVEALRVAGAPRGLIAFNALISQLAVATLDRLEDRGLGTKLSRAEVMGILSQVIRDLDHPAAIAAAP